MSANTTPIFTLTPQIGMVQISTANANRDGTGTLGTVLSGAVNGTRVDRITVTATVSTTAGMVRLFLYDGTNTRLFYEIPVTAITVSASVAGFTQTIALANGLVLPSGWSLKAATHNAETFNVLAFAGDF